MTFHELVHEMAANPNVDADWHQAHTFMCHLLSDINIPPHLRGFFQEIVVLFAAQPYDNLLVAHINNIISKWREAEDIDQLVMWYEDYYDGFLKSEIFVNHHKELKEAY